MDNTVRVCVRASCLSTFLVADTADDMTTGGDGQLTVSSGGEKAGVTVDPKRHLNTCKETSGAVIIYRFDHRYVCADLETHI